MRSLFLRIARELGADGLETEGKVRELRRRLDMRPGLARQDLPRELLSFFEGHSTRAMTTSSRLVGTRSRSSLVTKDSLGPT